MNMHVNYLFERTMLDFSSLFQFAVLTFVSQSHSQPTQELSGQQPLILVLWFGDCCTESLKHTRCKQRKCENTTFPRNLNNSVSIYNFIEGQHAKSVTLILIRKTHTSCE